MIRVTAAVWALVAFACSSGGSETADRPIAERPDPFEAPVATNAEPPVAFPLELFEQGVEGTVILRLFIDETGRVVPESTQVAEGSGYPALDSAALAGVDQMTFAPARRDGIPVPTTFLQPVHFRQPEGSTAADQP